MIVQVLFPLGLSGSLSYSVPQALQESIHFGVQVSAPIGHRKETGIVTAIEPDDNPQLKEIEKVDITKPVITQKALAFWQQIASYYLIPLGVVAKMALPSWRFNTRALAPGTASADRKPTKPVVWMAHEVTHYYRKIILEQVLEERQCLVLCASASACDSLYRELGAHLQIPLYCFHSQRSIKEQNAARKDLYAGVPCVVIGMQRAMFLPFTRTGLVVVHREQDPQHKTTDSAPRMHTRESALLFSQIYHTQIVIQCESPSLETLFNIKEGKFLCEGEITPERRITVENPYKTEQMVQQFREQGKNVWEYDPSTCRSAQLYGLEPNVWDVIVIRQCDTLLAKKGFRAMELAWRLIDYASYLASLVIVETPDRKDDFYQSAENLFPASFADSLLQERQAYSYPPYTRLITLTVCHKQQSVAQHVAAHLFTLVEAQTFPFSVFGPYPVSGGNSLLFALQIMLNMPRHINSKTVKERLISLLQQTNTSSALIRLDVDPL